MKAVCPRESLLSACQVAGGVIAGRDLRPILQNFKAVAGSKGCTLQAMDTELSIRLEVRSVKVEEAGEALLPANRLTLILREATDDDLVIDANADVAVVRGEFNEFEMPSADPAEFPPVPEFTDDKYHEVSAGSLREMIRRTTFAAAKEGANIRWGVPGVLWEFGDEKIRLVATDTRRLALATSSALSHGAADSKAQPHIVPVKAMVLLERLLQDPGEKVKVVLRTNEALFQTERATVCSRLIEMRFPPFGELVSRKMPIKLLLDTGRFYTAVRQANIMVGEESKRIEFTFGKKKLLLQAQGSTTGRAKVGMPIDYDGKELKINFDAGYLLEMLRVLSPDASLQVEMADANTLVLFRSGADYVYLVMPMGEK
jgi:DNA polymerase-3 subunit beta